MRRKEFFNIVYGSLLFIGAFLTSCNNDEMEEGNTSGSRVMTFDVSETFNESSDGESRAFGEKSDTVYQKLNNGMEIEAVIERDKAENSRAPQEVANGTKVLAIVINLSTNKIYKMYNLSVANNKLTCVVPTAFNSKVVFYSYNSTTLMPETTLEIGDDAGIYSKNNTEQKSKDVMWAETGTIYPSSTSLGTVVFKHLFARARVLMTRQSDYLYGFSVYFAGGVVDELASVNIIGGTKTSVYFPMQTTTTLANSDEAMAYAKYSPFRTIIPTGVYPTMINLGNINGHDLTGQSLKFDIALMPGYSYTIKIKVK
jgi:hypothetical protein